MKRLFTYISVLTLAVACETMYGPVQTPIAPDEGGAITITVDRVGDNDAEFTLTPAGEASYYSYFVEIADEAREVVDPQGVLNGAFKGEAFALGTIKWTADKTSEKVTLKKLPFATTVQIYAVAASPMGVVGAVEHASFTTSDTVAPVLSEEYEAVDSVLTLTFSEQVKRGEGALTVGVYAMNSEEIATGEAIGSLTVNDEKIVVDGNTVTVTVDNLPAGAFYALNYPEGAFVDPSNNNAAALASKVFFSEETSYEPLYVGVGGRQLTSDWGFVKLPNGITDPTAPIALEPDSPYGLGYIYEDPLTLNYLQTGKTTTFTLEFKKGYGLTAQGDLIALLPETPAPGTGLQLIVPAEAFEDYYGNYNVQWTGVSQMAYDMSLPFEDICGTFVLTHRSALTLETTQGLAILEESDDPFKGNVMFTAFDTFSCNLSPIYGEYDAVKKTLTFESLQPFALVNIDAQGTKGVLLFTSGIVQGSSARAGSDPVVFYLDENNLIEDVNYYYAIFIADTNGNIKSCYDFYMSCVATPYVPETSALQEKPNLKFYPLGTKVLY